MNFEWDEHIHEIIRLFKEPYTRADGLPHYDLDGKTGKPLSNRSLLSEIADYVPLLAKAGAGDYADQQLEILLSDLARNEPIFIEPQARLYSGTRLRLPCGIKIAHSDSYDYTEILYGLIDMSCLLNDSSLLVTADQLLKSVYRFFYRDGFLASWSLIQPRWKLPVFESLNGMYIEILADMYHETKKVTYLQMARDLAEQWILLPIFREKGIFPSIHITSKGLKFFHRFRVVTKRAELAKYNSCMANGLLALHREDPEGPWFQHLTHWFQGLHEHFGAQRGVYYHLSTDSPLPSYLSERPILSTNFAILDVLTNMYRISGDDEYLGIAKAGADFWLSQQSPKTGLFPDQVGQDRSFIDGNTDLIISLMRIFQLTGDEKYKHNALRSLRGILKYHKISFGYVRDVNIHTGHHLNSHVETRYTSLLLKPLLLFQQQLDLFEENRSNRMLQDR